jgi:hypothetical protein
MMRYGSRQARIAQASKPGGTKSRVGAAHGSHRDLNGRRGETLWRSSGTSRPGTTRAVGTGALDYQSPMNTKGSTLLRLSPQSRTGPTEPDQLHSSTPGDRSPRRVVCDPMGPSSGIRWCALMRGELPPVLAQFSRPIVRPVETDDGSLPRKALPIPATRAPKQPRLRLKRHRL